MVVALAVAIAIPVGLLLFKKDREREVAEVLAENGFTAAPCEVRAAIVDRPSSETCYRGTLAGVAAVAVFAERFRPGYVPDTSQIALDSYFGVLLEITPPVGWLDQLRDTGAFRIAEVSPGRIIAAWTGPATGADVQRHLDEVTDAVRKLDRADRVE